MNIKFEQVCLRMLCPVTFSYSSQVKLPVLHVHLLWYVWPWFDFRLFFIAENIWPYSNKFNWILINLVSFGRLCKCYYIHITIITLGINIWRIQYAFLAGRGIWGRWTHAQAWRCLCCIFTYNHGKSVLLQFFYCLHIVLFFFTT